MRKYKFPAIIEQDEDGWYVGIIPGLKGCHSQAKTLNELHKRPKEVIRLCLETKERRSSKNAFVDVH